MDKKKSLLNVTISIAFKLATMVMAIVVKRLLIQNCGNDVNGLYALYASIIGFLSVAELGLGTAITFSMYKPIVEEDHDQVSALFYLFQRLYYIIGGVILAVGLLLSPFIHLFAKDYTTLNVNLQQTFLLMLASVVLTYTFSAKTALFNAYKNNYITTAITSGGYLFQYVLQIAVLLLTRSFVLFLICQIITVVVQYFVTELLVWKAYPALLRNKQKVSGETKEGLLKSIKAMFMHKIGYVLVNTVDSIVISAFIGVAVLGKYSNYVTILNSMTGVLSLVFTSLTSVIGHLYVSETKETTRKYCESFHVLNYLMGIVFFLGCYAIVDDLVSILFSADLLVEKTLSFAIVLNGFIQFMRQTVLVFRDSTGTFYHDRWKPVAEGVFNVVFSVLFVKFFGAVGVIVATIATNLLICHVVEPYVLYKNAFHISPAPYYRKNYFWILLFTGALTALNRVMVSLDNHWLQLLANGFISVGVSLVLCLVVFLLYKKDCKMAIAIFRRNKV